MSTRTHNLTLAHSSVVYMAAQQPESIPARIPMLQILKPRIVRQIRQLNTARWPVPLLRNNDLCLTLQILILAVVVLLAMNEAHHVGILLNRTRLAQIA